MKTQSQAKAAASIPMSTKPLPHTSPIKEKSPIMELWSPLVKKNLPEPPIKDIKDTVPLPYDELLSAVKSLGKSPSKPEVVGKLREPETFTGKDLKQLKPFLFQCKLYFWNLPETFQEDSTKVNFALSYLWDVAQEWFEPGISGELDEILDWINNWNLFIDKLQTNFGPFDEVGDVEWELVNLCKSNQWISEYLVWFNSLSSQCQWGEPALRHHFYNGLPSRLKDDITKGDGKPWTLSKLWQKARSTDARYWEWQQECTQEQAHKQPQQKSQQQPVAFSSSSWPSNQSQSTDNKPADTKSGTSLAKLTPPQKSKLAGKLDSKGKLTPQERQHHVANNLCLYCSASGHKAIDYPHAKVAEAKAVSASESRSKPKDLALEQKKGWAIHQHRHKRWIARVPVLMFYKLCSWMQWTLILPIHYL